MRDLCLRLAKYFCAHCGLLRGKLSLFRNTSLSESFDPENFFQNHRQWSEMCKKAVWCKFLSLLFAQASHWRVLYSLTKLPVQSQHMNAPRHDTATRILPCFDVSKWAFIWHPPYIGVSTCPQRSEEIGNWHNVNMLLTNWMKIETKCNDQKTIFFLWFKSQQRGRIWLDLIAILASIPEM